MTIQAHEIMTGPEAAALAGVASQYLPDLAAEGVFPAPIRRIGTGPRAPHIWEAQVVRQWCRVVEWADADGKALGPQPFWRHARAFRRRHPDAQIPEPPPAAPIAPLGAAAWNSFTWGGPSPAPAAENAPGAAPSAPAPAHHHAPGAP
jgi:hypothetical protein